jgi:hypothetical protein
MVMMRRERPKRIVVSVRDARRGAAELRDEDATGVVVRGQLVTRESGETLEALLDRAERRHAAGAASVFILQHQSPDGQS